MDSVTDPRPLMVEIAHLLYTRYLTNSAGGNVSCRVGDWIYVTPRGLGSKHRWQLREDMVLVFDAGLNPLERLEWSAHVLLTSPWGTAHP